MIRACLLALAAACTSAPDPKQVVANAVDALDRHDLTALETFYVSSEQWAALYDCSKPTSLPIVPPDRADELAKLRARAADFASEPDRRVELVSFAPEGRGTDEWHDYKAGDAITSICVARRPFRAEKYRIELKFSAAFHGSTGRNQPVRLYRIDDRYWIKSDLLD